MKKQKSISKKYIALIITTLVFLVTAALHLPGVFNYLEYKSYDLRVRLLAGAKRPSDDVIAILLNQESLDWALTERGWGWPWPRQAYAEIVAFLNEGGAESVVFDVIFSEPSVYRNARQDEFIDNIVTKLEEAQALISDGGFRSTGPIFREIVRNIRSLSAKEDDETFIQAVKNYDRVVQTVFFSSLSGNVLTWPEGLEPPLFEPENFGSMLNKFSLGENMGGQFPITGLGEAAGALGSATGDFDSDGVVRRLRLFTLFDGRAVPGQAAASLLVSGHGRQISYDEKRRAIQWGDFSIPVDKNGKTLLRYRGELDRYFPYSAWEILQSAEALERGEEPILLPGDFENAHVFFGFYAPGLFDIFNTPINSVYPGVGCHITMLDNLLEGDFIRESQLWLNLLILFIVTGLMAALVLFSHRLPLTISGAIIVTTLTIAASFAAYQYLNLWLPMVTFLAGIALAFTTATLYNYATEGSQKRFIKSAFSQYLSPKVIDQIIADPSQLKLGGEKREMTAIFTDVRSFSTISEALGDPEKLVELLNFYLTRMSNIVLENHGTIDKYEGDAIIAFFGAPVHLPNHASLACRSAISMKKAEMKINHEALSHGLIDSEVKRALVANSIMKSPDDPAPLFTRLGVNTGDMVVGNMGTSSKMDYTIMGNAVNLAARLEGVNKMYNTGGILISEYTREHIGDEFIVRPLSRVRVVGINTPLRLFELLDIAEDAPSDLTAMVKSWEQGFGAYENRDFRAARDIFNAIYQQNSNDLAAKLYLNRCDKYLVSTPDAAAWNEGVDNLTEK
ncbi:MAG: adenylate/guanylate cyclase domain-containing protein [Treponema sp.]|nr:adenylate/guanylate cyclase domain-containing protein [Treponema sp.]